MKRRDDSKASAPNSRMGLSAAIERQRHNAKSAKATQPDRRPSRRAARMSFSVSVQGSDLASLIVDQTCGKRTAEAASVVRCGRWPEIAIGEVLQIAQGVAQLNGIGEDDNVSAQSRMRRHDTPARLRWMTRAPSVSERKTRFAVPQKKYIEHRSGGGGQQQQRLPALLAAHR